MHRLRALLLLSLITSVLSIEVAIAETLTARVSVPEVEDLLEQRYNRVVADAVALSLRQFGFETVEAEADLEVRIESAAYPPRLHLSISAFDAASGSLVAGVNGSGRTNVTLLNSVDALLSVLEEGLARYAGYLESGNPYVPIPETRELRFVNQDNRPILVYLNTGEQLLATEEPEALSEELTVALGTTLPIAFSAPFSEELQETVVVTDLSEPIVIPDLPELERFAASLRYSFGRMVGVGVGGRWYPVPDRFYISAESDIFLSGYGMPQTILHLDNRFLIGVRPGSASRRFRYSLGTGAGVMVSLPGPEITSFVDPYLNLVNLTLEYKLRRFVPFLRLGANYVLPGNFNLVPEGVSDPYFSQALSLGVRYVW
ncbi:MAG: hypothetical protein ACOCWS_00175 [Alkalispirochaetaceae bacterium]